MAFCLSHSREQHVFSLSLTCLLHLPGQAWSSLLGDILHLHEAGGLSVTPVHACPSSPSCPSLNTCSLFKHPNRNDFQTHPPNCSLRYRQKANLSQSVWPEQRRITQIWSYRHIQRQPARDIKWADARLAGGKVGIGLRGAGSDGDSRG